MKIKKNVLIFIFLSAQIVTLYPNVEQLKSQLTTLTTTLLTLKNKLSTLSTVTVREKFSPKQPPPAIGSDRELQQEIVDLRKDIESKKQEGGFFRKIGLRRQSKEITDLEKKIDNLFHIAIFYGKKEIVQRFITEENKPITPKAMGLAYQGGHTDIIDLLLEKKPVYTLNFLFKACEDGNYPIALHIVKKGVDLNVQDSEGNTPLHKACGSKHLNKDMFEVHQQLEQMKRQEIHEKTNINNQKNIMALLTTTYRRTTPYPQFLLSNIDVQNEQGETPLHIACKNGRLNIVKSLVPKRSKLIAKLQESYYFLGKNLGIRKELKVERANMLKENTASVSTTPVQYALQRGYVNIFRYLIKEVQEEYDEKGESLETLTYDDIRAILERFKEFNEILRTHPEFQYLKKKIAQIPLIIRARLEKKMNDQRALEEILEKKLPVQKNQLDTLKITIKESSEITPEIKSRFKTIKDEALKIQEEINRLTILEREQAKEEIQPFLEELDKIEIEFEKRETILKKIDLLRETLETLEGKLERTEDETKAREIHKKSNEIEQEIFDLKYTTSQLKFVEKNTLFKKLNELLTTAKTITNEAARKGKIKGFFRRLIESIPAPEEAF